MDRLLEVPKLSKCGESEFNFPDFALDKRD